MSDGGSRRSFSPHSLHMAVLLSISLACSQRADLARPRFDSIAVATPFLADLPLVATLLTSPSSELEIVGRKATADVQGRVQTRIPNLESRAGHMTLGVAVLRDGPGPGHWLNAHYEIDAPFTPQVVTKDERFECVGKPWGGELVWSPRATEQLHLTVGVQGVSAELRVAGRVAAQVGEWQQHAGPGRAYEFLIRPEDLDVQMLSKMDMAFNSESRPTLSASVRFDDVEVAFPMPALAIYKQAAIDTFIRLTTKNAQRPPWLKGTNRRAALVITRHADDKSPPSAHVFGEDPLVASEIFYVVRITESRSTRACGTYSRHVTVRSVGSIKRLEIFGVDGHLVAERTFVPEHHCPYEAWVPKNYSGTDVPAEVPQELVRRWLQKQLPSVPVDHF